MTGTPHNDNMYGEEDTTLMPLHPKTEQPLALAFAEIYAVSNNSAFHANAEAEIRGFIALTMPAHLQLDEKLIKVTYERGKGGFDIQGPLNVIKYIEEMGKKGTTGGITVDAFTDKKGTDWMKCEYVLQFMEFKGPTVKNIKKANSALWYTFRLGARTIVNDDQVVKAVSSTLLRANLLVTSAKPTLDASGTNSGNWHVDFAYVKPEEGMPWHLIHLTREVTLPIRPGDDTAQKFKMSLNPNMVREGRLCTQAYCHGICSHGAPSTNNPGKRTFKEQEKMRLVNKYKKGEGSSGYHHPPPRIP